MGLTDLDAAFSINSLENPGIFKIAAIKVVNT